MSEIIHALARTTRFSEAIEGFFVRHRDKLIWLHAKVNGKPSRQKMLLIGLRSKRPMRLHGLPSRLKTLLIGLPSRN